MEKIVTKWKRIFRLLLLVFTIITTILISSIFATSNNLEGSPSIKITDIYTKNFPYYVRVDIDGFKENKEITVALNYPRQDKNFEIIPELCNKKCSLDIPIKDIYLDEYLVIVAYQENNQIKELKEIFDLGEKILPNTKKKIKKPIRELAVFERETENLVFEESSHKYEAVNFSSEIELGDYIEIFMKKTPIESKEFNRRFKLNLDEKEKYIVKKIPVNSIKDINKLAKKYKLPNNDIKVKKPENLEKIESKSKLKVSKLKKFENNISDITFEDIKNKIEIRGVNLNKINTVEIIQTNVSKDLTDIVNVEVSQIDSASILLRKNNPKTITSIITCDYLERDYCVGGWYDSNLKFTQNKTHVWFNVEHFSAYAGVGPLYNYTIEFLDLSPQSILQNDNQEIQLNVTCNGGNCGNLNVTLNYAQNFTTVTNDDFESGFGFWTADAGTCTWALDTAGTPSAQTGPNVDNTLGTTSGTYLYVETSTGGTTPPYDCFSGDNSAILTGTAFEAGNYSTNLTFWYHMFGNAAGEMGDLRVDVFSGGSWNNDILVISGEQQAVQANPYLQGFVDLSSYSGTINIRFRYNNMASYRGDIAIDDILIQKVDEQPISIISGTTPFWTNSSNPTQINLNANTSQIVSFYLNATGTVGEKREIFAQATSTTNTSIRGQSSNLNLTISDSTPPTGIKLSPLNSSSHVQNNITFRANASDSSGLDTATLYIWNNSNSLIHTQQINLGGNITSNFSFNYNFTQIGNFTWNVLVKDVGGLESYLGENWTLFMNFPYLKLDYLFSDPLNIQQYNFNPINLNLTCLGSNCSDINLSAYYYQFNQNIYSVDNFESGFGNWTADTGTCTWALDSGGTPSGQTGPNVDNTLGTGVGTYLYVETSDTGTTAPYDCFTADNSAILTGTQFDIGDYGGSISFWYHMFGNAAGEMGDLFLDVYNGTDWELGVWSVSGEQQAAQTDPYLQAVVSLDNYSGLINTRLRFENMAVYRSDIAIDDIQINITSISPNLISTLSGSTPLWTNSSNPQTLSLDVGESEIITFYLNATGSILDEFYGSFDANLTTLINGFNANGDIFKYRISDPIIPNGTKIIPVNNTISFVRSITTFNATLADNFGLQEATLYIWDSSNNVVHSQSTNLSGALNAGVSFDYEFTSNGNFTWNILVEDLSGNQVLIDNGINWTINMDFPDLDVDILSPLLDPILILQNQTQNISINVSCSGGDCGLVNVSMYYIDTSGIFEGFESGGGTLNTSMWQYVESGANGRQRIMTAGTCTGLSPRTGTYNLGFDVSPTGTNVDNVLKSVFGFETYTDHFGDSFNLEYYITDQGDESQQCGDHSGDTCNGDGTFYTCDGNNWYEIDYYDPATLGDNFWNYRNIDLTSDPNFCSEINSSFAIKFSQYDNFDCNTDGIFFDDISIDFIQEIPILNISSQPIWIMNEQIKQVTLNQSESSLMSFNINATGIEDSSYLIFFEALSTIDSQISGDSIERNLTIVKPLNLNVTLTNPTPNNNSNISQNWVFVNTSIFSNYLDEVVLEWNGVNETISCSGVAPNYNCFVNKTSLIDGSYDYRVYVNDTWGYLNQTQIRRVNIDSTSPLVSFISPTPLNGSNSTLTTQTINLSVTENNLNNVTLEWNGVNETMSCVGLAPNYICSTTKNSLTTGNYTFRVYVNDYFGFTTQSPQRTFEALTPPITFVNKSLLFNKSISSINNNSYLVEISVDNLINNVSNISIIDFVDSSFNYSSFNILFNSSSTITGYYSGDILLWNFSIPALTRIDINYTLVGSSNYNLENNFIFGVQ